MAQALLPPRLPPELIGHIFSLIFDLRQLAAAATVCLTWREQAAARRNTLRLLRYDGPGFSSTTNLPRGRGAVDHHHRGSSVFLSATGDMPARLLVCEDGRLRSLSDSGTYLKPWRQVVAGDLRGSSGPSGLCCDPTTLRYNHAIPTVTCYISDAGTDIVYKLDCDLDSPGFLVSHLQRTTCGFGLERGRLSSPGSLFLCEQSAVLFVCHGDRVSGFGKAQLDFRGELGGSGREHGRFRGASDLTVCDAFGVRTIYVCDERNHRVQCFKADIERLQCGSAPLLVFGREGAAPGELRKPTSIASCRGAPRATCAPQRRSACSALRCCL